MDCMQTLEALPWESRFLTLGEGTAQRGSSDERKYPGEAALWVQGGGNARVAVDVGATAAMGTAVGEADPDVLILSHDDRDHVRGWDAFIAAVPVRVDHELWVPYEWIALAHAATTALDLENAYVPSIDEVRTTLAASAIPRHVFEEDRASSSGDNSREEEEQRDQHDDLVSSITEAQHIFENLSEKNRQEIIDRVVRAIDSARSSLTGDVNGSAYDITKRAVDSIETITKIIRDAHRSRFKIRIFSVDHVAPRHRQLPWLIEGRQGLATVPNAREIRFRQAGFIPTLGGAFALAILSVQNRRALSVLLWTSSNASCQKALIWSDSDGKWANRSESYFPIQHVALSTAPHHGSTKNNHVAAWQSLWYASRRIILICAGGTTTQRDTNATFLAAPVSQRACTRCRHISQMEKPSFVEAHVPPRGDARLVTAHCAE
jgi:hypothetical protein